MSSAAGRGSIRLPVKDWPPTSTLNPGAGLPATRSKVSSAPLACISSSVSDNGTNAEVSPMRRGRDQPGPALRSIVTSAPMSSW